MASLAIRRLAKRYGAVRVLEGIDIEVEDGEFLVLVGPSGCGKSTLLAMIAGLEEVSAGEIRIDDRVVNDVEPQDRNIAMVFQSYALYPTMTVRQNVTFGMEARGVPKARQKEAVERVSALLQIGHLLDRKPAQLSGGQRQRVAMGRALVRDPQIFLFDEPLSNLDARLRIEMRTEIKKLHQQVGTTTVYVTHDQVEAMTLASRIAVMHKGAVQQLADPRTVYERPANMFVAGFMGAPPMNFIPARVAGRDAVIEPDGEGGAPIALPLPGRPEVLSRYAGERVVLGVRPETITEPGRRRDDGRPLQGWLDVRVEVVEPTGAETMVVVRLGGREVIARVEPDSAPPPGTPMRFSVDMAKACLFDPDTERLIETGPAA